MKCECPEGLEQVDLRARLFPQSWKNAAIRELYDAKLGGVQCAQCLAVFSGNAGLRALQGDHIVPWSRGGQTTWLNLQLLCKPCNLAKLNTLSETFI
ncbi:MAG: HNH endonuclease [Burkholderiaceae bacterium]